MKLTEEDWKQVKNWLIDLRVACDKEKRKAKHEKIGKFYEDKSIQIRSFINLKDSE